MPKTSKSSTVAATTASTNGAGKSDPLVTTSFASPSGTSWLDMSASELLRELQSNAEFNTTFFAKYAEIQEIVKQYKAVIKAEKDAQREKVKAEKAKAERVKLIEAIQKIQEKDEDCGSIPDVDDTEVTNDTLKNWIKDYRAKIKATKDAEKQAKLEAKAAKEADKQAKLEAKALKDADTREKLIQKMGKFADAPDFDEDEISLADLKDLYKRTRLLAAMAKFEDAPDFDEDEISTADLNNLYQRTRILAQMEKLENKPEFDEDTIELADLKALYKETKGGEKSDTDNE